MESYLAEAFDKFLEKYLESFKIEPESCISSVDQLKGVFLDDLWERVDQYMAETDWDELISSKPEKEY